MKRRTSRAAVVVVAAATTDADPKLNRHRPRRMLRLNFRSINGDAPKLAVATFFRFQADGTLRGPENYLVARCVDGCWQLSGSTHRELDCEGPLKLRLAKGTNEAPLMLGPFAHVRTAAGMLYGDNACLNIFVPGRNPGAAASGHELTLLSVTGGFSRGED